MNPRPLIPGLTLAALVLLAAATACAPHAVLSITADAAGPCPALPPPAGPTVTVSTVAELETAVNNASSGDTILVNDGVYNLNGVYLRFVVPNVTLRSASGNRESVILDGNYVTTEIIQIVASNITIANLTLRRAYDHPIHVMSSNSADTTGTLIYNVHIMDPGQQAIKINPYTAENALYFPDNGVIACSHIELTDAGRPHIRDNCYTGGVDAHQARNWVIRDNLIEGFWCASGLAEHGIHLWRACRDTLVERNELRNNARGIGFGLATSGSGVRTYADNPCPGAGGGYVDHYGGIIRNNFVFANAGGLFASEYGFDCGICLWNACGARVLHNTVVSTQVPFSSIEWRFDYTDVDILYNLVSHNLRDRGGTATLVGNLTNRPLSLFADGANGNLHLVASATVAIDQAASLPDVPDDYDAQPRPSGPAPDIGADEYLPVTYNHFIYLPLALKGWTAPAPTPTVVPTATPTPTPAPTAAPPGARVQPTDLAYQGAFRLPADPESLGWEWSNWASALTYYPDGDAGGPADGYPGSLFGVGHDQLQLVSEVSIPVPVVSPGKDVADLHTAATLQDFHDIRGGLFGEMEMPRVGLAYLPAQGSQASGKLYFAWAPHLDEGAANPSHGWCALNLANPQSAGPWRIGDYWNYVTGDYLFDIPATWADAHVAGRYLATGRFRDGGQGAMGPALFAVAPWQAGNPPPAGATLPATPLLFYGNVYQSNPPALTGYHHSDEWTGGAWLTAGGKSAVVFVGTKGTGNCWYGCADGTVWEPPYPPECPDGSERGWWSTGFVGQFLFYDPADLAAVADGQMATWEPQPYATLNVDDRLYHIASAQQKYHLGAAAFDRARGLLYVLEPFGDGDRPLVHVWQIRP